MITELPTLSTGIQTQFNLRVYVLNHTHLSNVLLLTLAYFGMDRTMPLLVFGELMA